MQIPKDLVIQFIMSKIGGPQADQAGQELPDQVDTDKDAGLLSKFGVNPTDLIGMVSGGAGNGGGAAGGLGGLKGKLGL
ncbi:hypothetical protein [Quadrisphaera sp. INWT6]|uniref:hypothetical protein n=1 Tax=Quadrisphaera sp. INWT6 TaxID=2596917 RepID=UPI0018927368|nr:hypothetical protein [Quadrisphaera sp. INWT6]MBF5081963.1 hypothetical protein [Quadrisphaera sp. INWT6]